MSCVAQRRSAADPSARTRLKPVLSAPDYLALLNQRLQAHPMYLEGMAFPVEMEDEDSAESGDVGGEGLPLVVLVHDTRWDRFGVFASVIDEVKQNYELAPALASAAASSPACRQRGVQAGKVGRLRQAAR